MGDSVLPVSGHSSMLVGLSGSKGEVARGEFQNGEERRNNNRERCAYKKLGQCVFF